MLRREFQCLLQNTSFLWICVKSLALPDDVYEKSLMVQNIYVTQKSNFSSKLVLDMLLRRDTFINKTWKSQRTRYIKGSRKEIYIYTHTISVFEVRTWSTSRLRLLFSKRNHGPPGWFSLQEVSGVLSTKLSFFSVREERREVLWLKQ